MSEIVSPHGHPFSGRNPLPGVRVPKHWDEPKVVRLPAGTPPGSRVFQQDVSDGTLQVILSWTEEQGWHIALSHWLKVGDPFRPGPLAGRIPTWEEICGVRDAFVPQDAKMMMWVPSHTQAPRLAWLAGVHMHEFKVG